jgi:hypothetical protein
MSRSIHITRDEAELLTELLIISNDPVAYDLSENIRRTFGMGSLESELFGRGDDITRIKSEWIEKLQKDVNY